MIVAGRRGSGKPAHGPQIGQLAGAR